MLHCVILLRCPGCLTVPTDDNTSILYITQYQLITPLCCIQHTGRTHFHISRLAETLQMILCRPFTLSRWNICPSVSCFSIIFTEAQTSYSRPAEGHLTHKGLTPKHRTTWLLVSTAKITPFESILFCGKFMPCPKAFNKLYTAGDHLLSTV